MDFDTLAIALKYAGGGGGGGGGGGEQPDWNQNKVSASDYIKNRTHYAITTYTTKGLKIEEAGMGPPVIQTEYYFPHRFNNAGITTYPRLTEGMPAICWRMAEHDSSHCTKVSSWGSIPSGTPDQLSAGTEYYIFVDDEIAYQGTAISGVLTYYTQDGPTTKNGTFVGEAAEGGVMIFTAYATYTNTDMSYTTHLYEVCREIMVFVSDVYLDGPWHTLTLKTKSGETVVKLPNKYVDSANSAIYGDYRPITSNAAYNASSDKANTWDLDGKVDWDTFNDAIASKQDTLTFDNLPTSGSNNPVYSKGLWTIWQNIQRQLTMLDARVTALEQGGGGGGGHVDEDGNLVLTGPASIDEDGILSMAGMSLDNEDNLVI